MSARIGPNAILQLAGVLAREAGSDAAHAVFLAAGLRHHLDAPPTSMVPEEDVIALYAALGTAMGPTRAAALARAAGLATAEYLLAHRIPAAAKWTIAVLPARWGCRLLCGAIARHAWTFVGGGAFEWRLGADLELTIRDSPFARGRRTASPVCDFYAGTFEGLFRALIDRRARATETQCAATGAPVCRFTVEGLDARRRRFAAALSATFGGVRALD